MHSATNLLKLKCMEKLSRQELADIIDIARRRIIEGYNIGLCGAFMHAIDEVCGTGYIPANRIDSFIPEFTQTFFEVKVSYPEYDAYWWDYTDKKSRLKALDKLVKYYGL